jgi:hypothetical protein
MTENDESLRDVLDRLSGLAPTGADAPTPPDRALIQVKQRIAAQALVRTGMGTRRIEMKSNRRSWIAGLAAVLGLAVLLSIPSVRAAASEVLGLFRVQKFAPISISPEQIAVLEQLSESGLQPGEFVMVQEPGEPQAVSSLEEAAAITNVNARTLMFGPGEPSVYVMNASSGYLTVDLEGARAIMGATGADPMLLPDSLDGARIDFSMSPSVQQVWVDGTVLVQGPSPVVTYPPGVDPTAMGEALLQVLGLDAASAAQVAQSIDWTSTLLLPVPSQFATYTEVAVDGVTGVALTPIDGSSDGGIIWQKDGTIYMLNGSQGMEGLLALADSLQ